MSIVTMNRVLLIALMVAVLINAIEAFRPQVTARSLVTARRLASLSAANRHETKPKLDCVYSNSMQMEDLSNQRLLMGALLPLLATIASSTLFNSPALANELVGSLAEGSTNSGFVQSFLLIFVSEIGDKTFFIAGLLAAKYGRLISFTGSIGALAVMTVISTILGQLFHAVPSSLTQGVPYDDYIAVAAFTYFGGKTLLDALKLSPGDSSGIEEERAEAEEIVGELTNEQKRNSSLALIFQTFSLVFAAEIGDRSFLSTIALSAALNPYSVASGAIIAHGSATGIAVVGGAFMSKYLSERVIGLIGGSLFLVFALTTALGIF